jgi:prolyl oligopeptidase
MGGVVAIACVRGGGEYGEKWHKDGMLLKKQNSINDFVDVAQWLVDSKYTDSKRLGAIGISNGGLLVSAALNQRPDLFGAVVNIVGLSDMIRNESAKTNFDWTDEFGSISNEEYFRTFLSYSPLHNIRKNVEYPPVMVSAAELDDRVLPWHQYKYIASLQSSNLGSSPKLLQVSYGTGHAFGKPQTILLKENTSSLTFLATSLGMKFAQ